MVWLVHRYTVGLGPDHLDSFPSSAFGFNCIITLGKGRCIQSALAHQAIHPFRVGKLVPAISQG